MILYLDASAFVKLFVEESGSKRVADLVRKADSVVTSQVTYSEACSALARRRKEKRLTSAEFEAAKKNLDEIWPRVDTILVDELKSGELAIKHVIRGFDAIHIAAATELRVDGSAAIQVAFCSFDERQNDAARAEDLVLIELEK